MRIRTRPGSPPPPATSRRGVPSWQVVLLAAEITALAAVVEYLVVRRPLPALPDVPVPVSPALTPRPWQGKTVPPLGPEARLLAGLQETAESRLAPLDGLAPGSEIAQETQRLLSREQRLPIDVRNTIGMRFRLIPPGTFLMGSPETEPGRWDRETQHVVAVDRAFYLGVYEVTQAEWQQVMGQPAASGFRGPTRPVEEVTWYDAVRFAQALARKEGVPESSYRLPTEAEWEYACRAGTGTAFCFGDNPARLGNYADFRDNNNHGTSSVGQRRPNAYGLCDMHGNVWEWCADLFRDYTGAEADPATQGMRAIRGGNWLDPPENCRSANRCRLTATSHGNVLGFRLIRAIPDAVAAEPGPDQSSRGSMPVP